jgi:hypothetical protein
MNVIPLKIPAAKRAAIKLARWESSARFMAAIDALLDIRPRRTKPGAFDIVISPEGHVFVVDVDETPEYLGSLEDLLKNLSGIADAAQLDNDERAALMQAVEDAKVDEPFNESGA